MGALLRVPVRPSVVLEPGDLRPDRSIPGLGTRWTFRAHRGQGRFNPSTATHPTRTASGRRFPASDRTLIRRRLRGTGTHSRKNYVAFRACKRVVHESGFRGPQTALYSYGCVAITRVTAEITPGGLPRIRGSGILSTRRNMRPAFVVLVLCIIGLFYLIFRKDG